MSPLRRRMIDDMQIRNLTPNTQRVYIAQVVRFACHFRKSPELLGPAEIRTYLIHLTQERRLAASSIIVTVSALRFFFTVTLKRPWIVEDDIPAGRQAKKLPVVLSQEEVARFLDAVDNLKHRVILTVCYATGLRISEAVRLKATAIDSKRMVIRVEQGKGHVVFTVPAEIEVIAFQNQTVVYDILFRAASETLRTIAADPKHLGAEIGFLGVLHSWGQSLTHHPHLHFLVPGGGIAPDGESWIPCRPGFVLPVPVLSCMFRGLFLHALEKAFIAGELNFFSAHRHLHEPAAFRRYLAPAWKVNWVVYAKRPFAGPAQVLDYVGRYTHRVAISNNRLVSIDGGQVSFRWKDYVRREGAGG
jgi:integrase